MKAAPGGLRLRWIRFDDYATSLGAYATLLDDGERTRADRYAFDRDRRHFVITRALLRMTLAEALGRAPADLRFDFGPQDKPFLARPRAGSALQFNVSHAGDVAVIATAWHHLVGVDVERVRADIAFATVAERLFSPRERAELADVASASRVRAFFNIWTRKEAYIKAHGLGLSMPLDSFDVAVAPSASEALVATRPDPGDAARWSVRPLSAPPGYVAAVAYSAHASVPRTPPPTTLR